MKCTKYSKAQVIKYLAWTFGAAYLIQLVVAKFYNSGNVSTG